MGEGKGIMGRGGGVWGGAWKEIQGRGVQHCKLLKYEPSEQKLTYELTLVK